VLVVVMEYKQLWAIADLNCEKTQRAIGGVSGLSGRVLLEQSGLWTPLCYITHQLFGTKCFPFPPPTSLISGATLFFRHWKALHPTGLVSLHFPRASSKTDFSAVKLLWLSTN
jgi:hypothetical protein